MGVPPDSAAERPTSWWRERCLELLDAGDWYGLYRKAMAWRVSGGGSFTPDAWLMDVCSALLHHQPKTAIRCCDMALSVWIERPGDRAVLRLVRGLLIADHVGDPLRAVGDLKFAVHGPDWLAARAAHELERVTEEAIRSRVKKPRVTPSPDFDAVYRDLILSQSSEPISPPMEPLPVDGAVPSLWDTAMNHLQRL
ncbi:hypothetical protein OG978_03930 [Streptomyces sp. NBC_01591]|uniref:hypothetical protein n=1 Tax=Streptomyces sp. NBC_01591 TaxID=2975888 RepID=UPI002DD94D54|nr:hypothetical protein [Streptomyces sp. NBC_01591]WSD66599.1 hypothetical protein OG978_03930 [Streptomyces sp. NBC_01591]